MLTLLRLLICFVALAATGRTASKIDDAVELQRQGKLEKASDVLAAAAKQYRAAGDSKSLARALGIDADISVSLGRYDAAIRDAGEALRLRTGLKDTARVGDDYNTIGLAYQYKGDYPEALDAYQKALHADRSAGDLEGEITRLNNIGNIFYFQGRYASALRNYDDARSRLSGAAGAPWFAAKHKLTFANLAVVFQRLGQEQRALELYRGLAGEPSTGDMPPSERAQLLLNEGVLYRRLGDPVKALELYRAAQSVFQTDRHADGEVGALRNIGIVLAVDLNDVPGALKSFTRAFDLAKQSSNRRAVVQAQLYRGELLRRQGQGAEAQSDLRSAWSGAQQAGLVEEQWKSLYALGQLAEESGIPADAEKDYRSAISVIESVRGRLNTVSLRTDFLADKRDVYDSLIALRLRDARSTPAEIFGWMERSRARTLVDRTRGRLDVFEPRMAEIQGRLAVGTVLVEYWMAGSRGAALWITRTGSGLIRNLDADILKGIPLWERLIVVPDGVLSARPFETLPVPGSDALLIERSVVSYLPAASFLRSAGEARWMVPWSTTIVALADPLVTNDPFGEQWAPLPDAANEARGIAEELAGRAEIHLGADMQKRYLSEGAPLLHLATHASVDAASPERSRILFANDYLLLGEVYDLKLTGVDLVTLSACDTARGTVVAGEGVQAFSQAFLAAGAGSVVTTLWRVADGPTAEFMKQFYYELARGESKGEALRDAKLQFLRSGGPLSDARHWAAFILSGDGASAIPRAVSWSVCAMGAALVFAALGLAAGKLRRGRG